MTVLHEQLRRAQCVALAVAATAVVALTIENGQLPWIGLILAGSFGTYGLLKKQIALSASASLTAEALVLTPTLQFLWGVLVGHEPMPPARWVGFGLVWLALAVFTADLVQHTRVRAADEHATPVESGQPVRSTT